MSEAPKKDSLCRAKSARPVLSVFSPEHDGDSESPQGGWLSADMTLVEFYDAYVLPVCRKTAGRDPKTIALDRTALNFWGKITGNPPLHAIDDDTLVDFVDGYRQCEGKFGRPVQPNTVKKHCRALQFIIDRAGPKTRRRRNAKSLIPEPPAFPPIAVPETRRPPLSLDEIARWLDVCDRPTRPLNLTPVQRRKWWHALITVLYNTGFRVSTAVNLRWDMLGRDGWLDVPAEIMKGHTRGGEFYCNSHARKALESIRHFRTRYIFEWHDGRPPRSDSLQEEKTKMWHRAKLRKLHSGYHGLRRACLDWLAPRNVLAARFVAGHVVPGDMLQGHYTGPRTCVPEFLDALPQPRRDGGDPDQMRLF